MNNKGFTLIESIIVVSILALLVAILVPNVLGMITENDIRQCKMLKTSVEEACDIYISDNKYEIEDMYNIDCINNKINTFYVSLEVLTQEHYLTVPVINPITDEDLTNKTVKAIFNCTKHEYSCEFALDCE